LTSQLALADINYNTAKSYLADARYERNPDNSPHHDNGKIIEKPEVSEEENNLAESLAKKLTPLAAILVTLAVVILGAISIDFIGKSIAPEIVNRTKLIGEIVNTNIQRAVSAGIPIDKIVGADRYLANLLRDFQEVCYIGLVGDEPIVEVGKREESSFSPTQLLEDELFYSITHDDQIIGKIIIDVDSAFIAQQFNEVNMDLIVVIMVAIMITFESMVVMIGRTITAPIQRLQTLASMQALGDFSKYAITRSKDCFDHILEVLSGRAKELHELINNALKSLLKRPHRPVNSANLENIKARYHLFSSKPKLLTFSNLNDIRWPLFLFVAADELPLSFFPLFTRAAENPWGWLDQGIVISLPLIGYLLAIFTSSPVARLLTSAVGHRKLLFFAMAPAVITHIGLFFSTTVPEIVLFRTLSGFGYAIATLAYQDYVLDMIPKEHRTKSIGNFTAVLVGGIFCGTAIGGILADRLGQHAVFLISALLVVISCALILLFVPSKDKALDIKHRIEVKPSSIVKALSDKHFSSLVLGIAIPCNIIMQAFIAFLVALYMNELGASTAETGRTLMGYFLMIYFVGPISTKLSDSRVDPSIVTMIGASCAGASLLFASFVATKQALLLAVLGAGFGHGLVRSHQLSVVMHIAESSLVQLGLNVVLGTLRTLERGGSIFGLLTVAWLCGLVGYQGAIRLIGLLSLLGVVLFFFGNMVGIKTAAVNR
ncbi:MAG: MFS transporter, partial [Desulfofustis sp.]